LGGKGKRERKRMNFGCEEENFKGVAKKSKSGKKSILIGNLQNVRNLKRQRN